MIISVLLISINSNAQSKEEVINSLQENILVKWNGTDAKDRNGGRLLIKFTGNLDTLIVLISEFHKESENSEEKNLPSYTISDCTYKWQTTANPYWIYGEYAPTLKAYKINGRWILEIHMDSMMSYGFNNISYCDIKAYQNLINTAIEKTLPNN